MGFLEDILSNASILSPNLARLVSPETTTGDILSPRVSATTGDILSPRINLEGTIQVGDSKKAILYAPILNISSPYSTLSSQPAVPQESRGTATDFLTSPLSILAIGAIGIGTYILLSGD